MFRYLQLISFGAILVLVSCSANQEISRNQDNIEKTGYQYLEITLPDWLINVPSGSQNIIGISKTSRNTEEMITVAREMAAVQYARNLSSFNISKYIQVDRSYTDVEYHDSRNFNFQVSDPSRLWKIYEHLHLIDHYILHNTYFFALFEIDESRKSDLSAFEADTEFSGGHQLSPSVSPEWYREEGVSQAGNYLVSTSKASSSCLIDAWTKATQEARLMQSAFYSTMVESLSESGFVNQSEQVRSVTALETLYNLRDIELSKSYVRSMYRNNNLYYTVYIELRILNYIQ